MEELLIWFWDISLIEQAALIWFVAINIVTFFVYGFDKIMATARQRRVPEKSLWLLALVGGSLGAICSMEYFHHKTKKMSFYSVLVLILLVQLVVLFFLISGSLSRFS